MSGWVAVTFYTTGTGYEHEVRRLITSAHALEVPLEVYAYPPRSSWRESMNYKSECILRAMDEFPGVDIVFVDADAVFRAWPVLFDKLSEEKHYDMAVCYLRHSASWDELLSGTVWFQNPKAQTLVRRWDDAGRRYPVVRHQKCLDMTVKAERPLVYRLPFEYTCIFDHPHRKGREPVIEHFQASRKYRRALSSHRRRRIVRLGPLTSAGLGVVR